MVICNNFFNDSNRKNLFSAMVVLFSDEWLQFSTVKVWHQLRVNVEHGNDEEGNGGGNLFNVFKYMSNRLKIKSKTVCGQLSLVGQSVDTVK